VELQDRNLRIVQMVQQGYSLQVVADQHGLSRARISQIVSEYHAPITDDSARDVLRTKMESWIDDELIPIIKGPGLPLFSSGSGKLILDPEGNMIYDKRIKLQAVDSAIRVVERLTKMNAWDRPKAREKDESKEIAEAMAYLNELAAEKQELQARVTQYEATVVPPPEPPHDITYDAEIEELRRSHQLLAQLMRIVLSSRLGRSRFFPGSRWRVRS
jgi:hypothetical protein